MLLQIVLEIFATLLLSGPFFQTESVVPQDLFATSFEDQELGAFRSLTIGTVRIVAEGKAAISDAFFRSGKRSLHLTGDESSSLIFHLPAPMQHFHGLSFHAERWTSKGPFVFAIDELTGAEWKEVARLDRVIEVGKRFRTHIELAFTGETERQAIRFRVIASPNSGVLIDDLTLTATAPKKPTFLPSEQMPLERLELSYRTPVFVSGSEETHTFRIPAIITAANGDLIAACDARRRSSADLKLQRTIDIVYRRSSDNGATWSPMEVLSKQTGGGCSDPSLLLDTQTGDLFCFYNFMVHDTTSNEFRFVVQKSSDHGKSWGKPIDFTDQVAGPELKNSFKFITSGRGIRTRDGKLLHNFVRVGQGVTLFGSQDHGESWKSFGDLSPGDESKVVQLHDGMLLVNSRVEPGRRFVHRLVEDGLTWESHADWSLPDPQCNACIIQYTSKRDGYDKDRLVFCNAASLDERKNLTVRISYDGGQTWSSGKVIDEGPSAYSEITVLQDGSFGVLYEPGYKEVRFVRFTLEALTNDLDRFVAREQQSGTK